MNNEVNTSPVIQHALTALALRSMPLSRATRDRHFVLTACFSPNGYIVTSFHATEKDALGALHELAEYFGEKLDTERSRVERMYGWPFEPQEAI